MDKNIPDIVSQCLFTFGKVTIPGFGTFSISDSSSGFVLKDDLLKPPTQLVEFSEESEGEETLINFLQTKHFYPKSDAEQAVNSYSKSLLNSLMNYGVVDISKIGKLTKLTSNEIIFEPSEDFINFENYALPTLQLTPIDRGLVAEKPELPAVAIPAAATVAAFTPTEVIDKLKPAESVDNTRVEKVIPLKEELTPKPVAKESVVKKVEIPAPVSEVINEVPPPIIYEDETSFGTKVGKGLLGLLLLCALGLIFWKGCQHFQGKKASPIVESTTEEPTEENVMPKEASLAAWIKENPKMEKYADVLTTKNISDGCIIVVGSFQKSRNAIRMKDRLIKGGYSPYTEVHNGLTRVGLLFPCEEHDLAGYVDTIRRKFDRGAWYLSPDLVVSR